MSYEFHTEKYKGCTIRIVQDDSPSDPRKDYDHLGTMVPYDNNNKHHWSFESYSDRDNFLSELAANQLAVREKLTGKSYSTYLVDEADETYMNMPDIGDLTEMVEADNVIIGYNYYEHGCQTSFAETNDWVDCSGYFYMTMDLARKNWTGTDNEIRAAAEACLRAELEELNNWAQGNVAGWIAEDPDGETIESVWGYYPDEYPTEWDHPISEARNAIDHWHKEQHELSTQLCMNI